MSKILRTTVAIIALSATPALAANYHYRPWAHTQTQADTHAGYAASRELWPWYVPSHGIVGESCGDAFQPICK